MVAITSKGRTIFREVGRHIDDSLCLTVEVLPYSRHVQIQIGLTPIVSMGQLHTSAEYNDWTVNWAAWGGVWGNRFARFLTGLQIARIITADWDAFAADPIVAVSPYGNFQLVNYG
ncbi:hypothetical protein [Chroococcidiopsis sp.]|uniref:hypothetical protein n=1 Tax=Chroococcidiopsis sp. TaxID=3088168 RepID=UPI003F2D7A17